MAPFTYGISFDKINSEYLKIEKTKARRRIKSRFFIIMAEDKDSKQITYYLPSLEISGYGSTKHKALKMLNECVEEFFKYLLDLPQYKLQMELSSLGWKHNTIKKKEYSKSAVDIAGQLKNFNIEESKLELGFVEA